MKVLKKLSFPLIFLLIFASCKNKNDSKRKIQLLNDSTAYHNNSSTDSLEIKEENKANTGTYHYYPDEAESNKGLTEKLNSKNEAGQNKNDQSTSTTPVKEQKKGWSKGAQGAVIGGAAGAVGGAIISKHKGTGAAIGAAVGAAGGYIIGYEKDKKDGRVEDKKK